MIEIIEPQRQVEFQETFQEETQTKFPDEIEYNEFTRKILSVLKYLQSKNSSTKYDDIYRTFCSYYADSHSTETFSRKLRQLANQKPPAVNKKMIDGRVHYFANVIVAGQDNFPLVMREK